MHRCRIAQLFYIYIQANNLSSRLRTKQGFIIGTSNLYTPNSIFPEQSTWALILGTAGK